MATWQPRRRCDASRACCVAVGVAHSALALQAARVAAEGLVGVASSAHAAVLVELNCETDFVARNPKFQVSTRFSPASVLALTQPSPQALLAGVAASALKLVYSKLQSRYASPVDCLPAVRAVFSRGLRCSNGSSTVATLPDEVMQVRLRASVLRMPSLC